MEELARFLLKNVQLDFAGEVDLEAVRELLREDDSREARALLSRLIEDRGVDSMLLTIADCLKEQVPRGITPEVIRSQLKTYSDS